MDNELFIKGEDGMETVGMNETYTAAGDPRVIREISKKKNFKISASTISEIIKTATDKDPGDKKDKGGKRDKGDKPKDYRPLVYICSPYGNGEEVNIETARRFSRYAYENGVIPITPHLMFPQFMKDDGKEREDALRFDLILMGKCQEVWVLGDRISEGMKEEVQRAKIRRQKIRRFVSVDDEFLDLTEVAS